MEHKLLIYFRKRYQLRKTIWGKIKVWLWEKNIIKKDFYEL